MAVLDAQGATFYYGGVRVGGIKSFTGFDGQASDIDITTLDSTAKEWRQGLQDFGNFSMEVMRDPADVGQAAMEASKAAQGTEECVLTLRTGEVATFDAYVKQISSAGGVDAVVTGTISLKVSGEVVWS